MLTFFYLTALSALTTLAHWCAMRAAWEDEPWPVMFVVLGRSRLR